MYKLDRNNNQDQLTKLTKTSLTEQGLRERFDLEKWIADSPDVLGEDLLVLQTEYTLPSDLRIDILALDTDANLVIIELKRDKSGDNIDWQAVKYASYCSNLTVDQLSDLLAKRENIGTDSARLRIKEFIDEELVDEDLSAVNQDQRIILLAGEFHPYIISSVLWLREYGVDIRCIRFQCFVDDDGTLFINPEVIIPLPEAEDYTTRKEAKEQVQRKNPEHERTVFSLAVENLSPEGLSERLLKTLNQSDSALTPRLLKFLEILLSEDRAFGREEVKEALLNCGIGRDIGQAGRFLSNLSQFLTKPKNTHLRQIIKFDGGERHGQIKDNYQIKEEYQDVVRNTLQRTKASSMSMNTTTI